MPLAGGVRRAYEPGPPDPDRKWRGDALEDVAGGDEYGDETFDQADGIPWFMPVRLTSLTLSGCVRELTPKSCGV